MRARLKTISVNEKSGHSQSTALATAHQLPMEIGMQSFTRRRSAKIINFSKAQHLGSKPLPSPPPIRRTSARNGSVPPFSPPKPNQWTICHEHRHRDPILRIALGHSEDRCSAEPKSGAVHKEGYFSILCEILFLRRGLGRLSRRSNSTIASRFSRPLRTKPSAHRPRLKNAMHLACKSV